MRTLRGRPNKTGFVTGGAMSDSSVPRSMTQANVGRRGLLKGLAGMAGLAAAGPVLGACGSSGSPSSGGGSGSSHTSTFGKNYSAPAPKQAFAALVTGAGKATGTKITVNTVDHNTFQQ